VDAQTLTPSEADRSPATTIVAAVGEADVGRLVTIMVVGTHDAGPATDVAFGLVADALLRRKPCPALLVRPLQPGAPEVCGGSTCTGYPHLREAFFDTALPCRALGVRSLGGAS
jgi:hypothetical protein